MSEAAFFLCDQTETKCISPVASLLWKELSNIIQRNPDCPQSLGLLYWKIWQEETSQF